MVNLYMILIWFSPFYPTIGKSLHFQTDLPGIDKKDIQVTINNQQLNVFAETKESTRKDTDTSHIKERRTQRYRRSIRLPAEVDEGKIVAKMENGTLSIEMPKIKANTGKQKTIEIK